MKTLLEIQSCINGINTNSKPVDFTLLAAETSNANTGMSFSVATVDDLPDLENTDIGEGQVVFVESIGVPVISTENAWRGLDGRLLKKFFDMNQLFLWGSNSCGVLGNGTTTATGFPSREISFSTDWCLVSLGCSTGGTVAAIKNSGELWTWGASVDGILGDGAGTGVDQNRCSPAREFCSATDWCQVSVGFRNMFALKTDGTLWVWGGGGQGRLGTGSASASSNSPVREFCSATDWCQVSAGGYHGTAIKTSGQLWAWGRNFCGQIGDGTTISRCSQVREICSATNWCQVSASRFSINALKTSGELWTWGDNNFGRLGDGTTIGRCSPVREFCSATNWCQVSAGDGHVAALKTSGELWVWGNNGSGRLGDGTTTSRCSPVREFCSATAWCQVSAGVNHSSAIKTSGDLWITGSNGAPPFSCSPVRERTGSTDWCQVSSANPTGGIRLIT